MASFPKTPGTETIKWLFDHAKNFMTCAGLYAAGALASRNPVNSSDWLPAWLSQSAGWGVIGLAIALALLNLVDGVRHLSRVDHPRLLIALFITAYVLGSARVLTLVAAVRLAGSNSK
jgi:hypothetical protein